MTIKVTKSENWTLGQGMKFTGTGPGMKAGGVEPAPVPAINSFGWKTVNYPADESIDIGAGLLRYFGTLDPYEPNGYEGQVSIDIVNASSLKLRRESDETIVHTWEIGGKDGPTSTYSGPLYTSDVLELGESYRLVLNDSIYSSAAITVPAITSSVINLFSASVYTTPSGGSGRTPTIFYNALWEGAATVAIYPDPVIASYSGSFWDLDLQQMVPATGSTAPSSEDKNYVNLLQFNTGVIDPNGPQGIFENPNLQIAYEAYLGGFFSGDYKLILNSGSAGGYSQVESTVAIQPAGGVPTITYFYPGPYGEGNVSGVDITVFNATSLKIYDGETLLRTFFEFNEGAKFNYGTSGNQTQLTVSGENPGLTLVVNEGLASEITSTVNFGG